MPDLPPPPERKLTPPKAAVALSAPAPKLPKQEQPKVIKTVEPVLQKPVNTVVEPKIEKKPPKTTSSSFEENQSRAEGGKTKKKPGLLKKVYNYIVGQKETNPTTTKRQDQQGNLYDDDEGNLADETWDDYNENDLNRAPVEEQSSKTKEKDGSAKEKTETSKNSVKVIRDLGGSTGAKLVEDTIGNKFVMKQGASPGHLAEEKTADRAYQSLGIVVPKIEDFEYEGNPAKLATYVNGIPLGQLSGKKKASAIKELQKGFVADALLGNWDVIGLDEDNIIVTPDGKVVRIDNGGSLRYRAQGAKKKPEQFGPEVTELDSMRDPDKNPSAGSIFQGITDEEINEQIKEIVSNKEKLLATMPDDLKGIIRQRIDNLQSRLPKASPSNGKSKPDYVGKLIKGDKPDIPDFVKNEAKHLFSVMDADIVELVQEYTSIAYENINKEMRKCPPDFDCVKGKNREYMEDIENAISQAKPFKEPVTVYRGLRLSNGTEREEFLKIIKGCMELGVPLKMPSITSTTLNPHVAVSEFSSTGGQTGLVFYIKAKSGLYVESITDTKFEEEVLKSANTQYNVVGIEENVPYSDKYGSNEKLPKVVYLEEV